MVGISYTYLDDSHLASVNSGSCFFIFLHILQFSSYLFTFPYIFSIFRHISFIFFIFLQHLGPKVGEGKIVFFLIHLANIIFTPEVDFGIFLSPTEAHDRSVFSPRRPTFGRNLPHGSLRLVGIERYADRILETAPSTRRGRADIPPKKNPIFPSQSPHHLYVL